MYSSAGMKMDRPAPRVTWARRDLPGLLAQMESRVLTVSQALMGSLARMEPPGRPGSRVKRAQLVQRAQRARRVRLVRLVRLVRRDHRDRRRVPGGKWWGPTFLSRGPPRRRTRSG